MEMFSGGDQSSQGRPFVRIGISGLQLLELLLSILKREGGRLEPFAQALQRLDSEPAFQPGGEMFDRLLEILFLCGQFFVSPI